MNPKRILEEIVASVTTQGPIASGRLLRAGPASYAFIPNDAPHTVVKIIKPNHRAFGLNVAEEFELIHKISHLTGEHFRLPQAIACGHDPDFISLENIGDAYIRSQTALEEATLIGRAFGEFSVKLFQDFGFGHGDLCLNNSTHPQAGDSRIGIIDLASVGPVDRLEDIFLCPRYEHPNLCVAMAEAIETSGYKLDIEALSERMSENDAQRLASRSERSLVSYRQELLPRSQATIEALQAWRRQTSYQKLAAPTSSSPSASSPRP